MVSAVVVAAAVLAQVLAAVPAGAEGHDRAQRESLSPQATGSTWTGRISISRSQTTVVRGPDGTIAEENRLEEDAVLTNLVSLASTATGQYTGLVSATGNEDHYWSCQGGPLALVGQTAWDASGDYSTDPLGPLVINLRTDEAGNTFVTPGMNAPSTTTGRFCGEESTTSSRTYDALWFTPGISYEATQPLPDEDPDPAHLAGSRTWTLEDPPYELGEDVTAYSFTIDYDLALAYRCTSGDERLSAQYDGVFADYPALYFSLDDVTYCYGAGTVVLRSPGTTTGVVTLPPSLAAALSTIGAELTYVGPATLQAGTNPDGTASVLATGRFDYCQEVPGRPALKVFTKVLKVLPGRVERLAKRWLARGVGTLVRKLGSRFVPDGVRNRLLEAAKEGLAKLGKNPQDEAAIRALLENVSGDKLVDLFLDGACVPKVWEPSVSVAISPDGSTSVVGDGPVGLFTTTPHTATGTGTSS